MRIFTRSFRARSAVAESLTGIARAWHFPPVPEEAPGRVRSGDLPPLPRTGRRLTDGAAAEACTLAAIHTFLACDIAF
jgi:hypothetical protein